MFRLESKIQTLWLLSLTGVIFGVFYFQGFSRDAELQKTIARVLGLDPFSNSIMSFVVIIKYFVFSLIIYGVHRTLYKDSLIGKCVKFPVIIAFMLIIFLLHAALYLYDEPETSSIFIAKALIKMSIYDLSLMVFSLLVILPIAEEICFRGALMGGILKLRVISIPAINTLIAIILPSTLFAIVHLKYDQLSTYLSLFFFSIVLSLARLYSGGLLLPILIHSFSNLNTIVFGLLGLFYSA